MRLAVGRTERQSTCRLSTFLVDRCKCLGSALVPVRAFVYFEITVRVGPPNLVPVVVNGPAVGGQLPVDHRPRSRHPGCSGTPQPPPVICRSGLCTGSHSSGPGHPSHCPDPTNTYKTVTDRKRLDGTPLYIIVP